METNTLPPGYRLLWYEIESILGQGGFGITYLAKDTNLDQQVAIKEFFPTSYATRTQDIQVRAMSKKNAETYAWGLTRFLTEAQTLAKFRHPCIVQVFSVFEANGTAYMVMEFVRGESLGDQLKSGRGGDEAHLLQLANNLLDGLQLIHDAGFIHRDIKPDNIFLRESGSPVLLDFGSARLAIGTLTQTLTMLVSPGYAPFEQYSSSQSEGGRQGPWTDLYSLGATLYMAISGRGPADSVARATATLSRHADPMLPAVDVGKGRYSPQFLAAIDRALAIQPHDRPQSIAEWRALLPGQHTPDIGRTSATVGHAPVNWAHPSTAPQEQTRPLPAGAAATRPPPPPVTAGKGRALAAAGGLGLALLAAGAFIALRDGDKPRPDPSPPKTATPTVEVPKPPPNVPTARPSPPPEPPSQPPSPEQRIATLFEQAEIAMSAGRLSLPAGHNALDYFREVLTIAPDNPEARQGIRRVMLAHLAFALTALKQNALVEARQHLEVAESIDREAREVVSARKQLDTAELVVRQQREAEESRKAAIASRLADGRAALEAGRLGPDVKDGAIDAFRAALKLDPGNVDARKGIDDVTQAHLDIAMKAIAAGEFDEARSHIDTVAAIDAGATGLVSVRNRLGAAERTAAERAERIRSELAAGSKAFAEGRIAPPERENAYNAYRSVLQVDPDNAQAKAGVGQVLQALLKRGREATQAGDFAAAAQALDAMASIDPASGGLAPARAALDEARQAALEKQQAERARLEQIDRLLAAAAADLQAGRIAAPGSPNAADRYREVLALDSDNEAAQAGLKRVASQLLAQAEQAIRSEDLSSANALLEAAAGIDARGEGLAAARRALADARKALDRRQAEALARQERIDRQLASADKALRAGRLSPPGRDNALDGYRAALELDSGNARAQQGIQAVAAAELTRGREAIAAGDLDKARDALKTAEGIDASVDGLADTRRILADAERAQAERQARAEAEAAQRKIQEAEARREAEAKRAAAEQQARVAALIDRGQKALAANRLTTPAGNNALTLFRQALELDPANQAAQDGLEAIVAGYRDLAAAALERNDPDRAEDYIERAAGIAPRGPALADMRARLAAWRDERQAREAREREARAQAEAEAARVAAERERLETARREEALRSQAGRIDTLLSRANAALAADRLTQPRDDNALDGFRTVLSLDPGNEAAERGINQVAERYVTLAARATRSGDLDAAGRYLDSASQVRPGLASITLARESLTEARASAARDAAAREAAAREATARETAAREAAAREAAAREAAVREAAAREAAERAAAAKEAAARDTKPVRPPTPAAVDVAQLMGTWCGAGMSVQFASGNWTFTLPGGNRASYAVSAYTPGANSVTMSWTDDQRRKMQTQFGQFSEDGRSMVQLRGREQGSDDWHEYNRRFTRCG